MRCRIAATLLVGACVLPGVIRAQALETETTRLLPKHGFTAGTNFEYQFSSDGREVALPVAFEYGLSNTWELMVEPVPYTRIRPNTGPRASGLGDLEVTLTHRFLGETTGRPALALAGEVKVPTAESRLIGTDRPDYTGYLIASKRFGAADIHANLGYAILGKPTGVRIRNVVNFALAGVMDLSPRTQLYGEVLGNTSASPAGVESGPAAEVSGGEFSGTIGVLREVGGGIAASFGMTLDNSGAFLLRPGFTVRLH